MLTSEQLKEIEEMNGVILKAFKDCISQGIDSPMPNEAIPLISRSIARYINKINGKIDFYNEFLLEGQEPFKRIDNLDEFTDLWFEAVEWFR